MSATLMDGFIVTATPDVTVDEESKMSKTTLDSLTLFRSEANPAGRVDSTNARTLDAAKAMEDPESDKL